MVAALLGLGSLYAETLLAVPGSPCSLVAALPTKADLLAACKHKQCYPTAAHIIQG